MFLLWQALIVKEHLCKTIRVKSSDPPLFASACWEEQGTSIAQFMHKKLLFFKASQMQGGTLLFNFSVFFLVLNGIRLCPCSYQGLKASLRLQLGHSCPVLFAYYNMKTILYESFRIKHIRDNPSKAKY